MKAAGNEGPPCSGMGYREYMSSSFARWLSGHACMLLLMKSNTAAEPLTAFWPLLNPRRLVCVSTCCMPVHLLCCAVLCCAAQCLMLAVAACKPGVRYRDMGDIITKHAHAHG